ncbi:MAG: serine hydrolase, partial [Flavobacteriia bacterium]|nr:serine hydrolase [Flavobacteriia bacterium]
MKAFASILCLILFFCNGFLHAQKIDKKLEQKVQEQIRGFKGQIGIYIKSLRTGKQVLINADTIFPTASIVKVPILIGIMDKIER